MSDQPIFTSSCGISTLRSIFKWDSVSLSNTPNRSNVEIDQITKILFHTNLLTDDHNIFKPDVEMESGDTKSPYIHFHKKKMELMVIHTAMIEQLPHLIETIEECIYIIQWCHKIMKGKPIDLDTLYASHYYMEAFFCREFLQLQNIDIHSSMRYSNFYLQNLSFQCYCLSLTMFTEEIPSLGVLKCLVNYYEKIVEERDLKKVDKKMESKILQTLDYQLFVPSITSFLTDISPIEYTEELNDLLCERFLIEFNSCGQSIYMGYKDILKKLLLSCKNHNIMICEK